MIFSWDNCNINYRLEWGLLKNLLIQMFMRGTSINSGHVRRINKYRTDISCEEPNGAG